MTTTTVKAQSESSLWEELTEQEQEMITGGASVSLGYPSGFNPFFGRYQTFWGTVGSPLNFSSTGSNGKTYSMSYAPFSQEENSYFTWYYAINVSKRDPILGADLTKGTNMNTARGMFLDICKNIINKSADTLEKQNPGVKLFRGF